MKLSIKLIKQFGPSTLTLGSVFLIFILLIQGCDPQPVATDEPMLKSTPTSCPPPTAIVVTKANREPYHILVLLENTLDYQKNGYVARTQQVLTMLFQEILRPGDRVTVALLSKNNKLRDANNAIIFDTSVEVVPTQIPPTPIPTPTDIQTPTPIPTRRSNLGATAVAKTQMAINEQVVATQTAMANNYNCSYGEANSKYVVTLQALDATQQEKVNEFLQEFDKVLISPKTERDEGKGSKPVFERLKMAGDFLQKYCTDKYSHCILLTFSDLDDYRQGFQTSNININLDLTNIDVISVLYDCKYDDGSCGERMSDWERHFSTFGAQYNEFIYSHENNVEKSNMDILDQLTTYFKSLEQNIIGGK